TRDTASATCATSAAALARSAGTEYPAPEQATAKQARALGHRTAQLGGQARLWLDGARVDREIGDVERGGKVDDDGASRRGDVERRGDVLHPGTGAGRDRRQRQRADQAPPGSTRGANEHARCYHEPPCRVDALGHPHRSSVPMTTLIRA